MTGASRRCRRTGASESPPPAVAAPQAAPAAALEPMTAIVQLFAQSGGGKIDASVCIALVMMVNQMNQAQQSALEERQRQWRHEDEARAAEREREHERRLERERTFATEDRQRITTFYTAERVRGAATDADERMRRLEEKLEDALDLLDEQSTPQAPAEKSVTDQVIEALLPVVAGRLGQAMAAAPAPPSEPKS